MNLKPYTFSIKIDCNEITQIGQNSAISRCEYYRDEFDHNIYPKNIEYMGSPDGTMGDIDGDPKVTILFYPIKGGGGYYLESNKVTLVCI